MNLRDRIRKAMNEKGLTPAALARASRITPTSVSLLLSGDSKSMKGETATRMAAALNVNSLWLTTGEGDMRSGKAQSSDNDPRDKYEFATRVRGAVLSAGNGATTWEHEEIDGSHAFTRDWLRRKGLNIKLCRVLTVQGDSMLPELGDGYVVLIDLNDTHPIKSGKVYALSFDGEERIKRLFRQADGSLRITSDNPNKALYPDEVVVPEFLERVRIIGRKRWHAGDDD